MGKNGNRTIPPFRPKRRGEVADRQPPRRESATKQDGSDPGGREREDRGPWPTIAARDGFAARQRERRAVATTFNFHQTLTSNSKSSPNPQEATVERRALPSARVYCRELEIFWQLFYDWLWPRSRKYPMRPIAAIAAPSRRTPHISHVRRDCAPSSLDFCASHSALVASYLALAATGS